MSNGSQFWLIGEEGDGWEGGPLAPGVDGKAGGAGLLWGVELVYSLLRSNRAKSPRRVPHVVSRVCSLAREGLESGH